MGITFILGLSMLLQLTAAFLAVRLIPITGRRTAWVLISVAIVLMASRRSITLIRVLTGDITRPPDPTAEWVALVISACLVIGISRIGPDFLSIRRAENRASKSEAELAHAQEISHLGSWVWETKTNELRWSDEVYRIFGLKPQEFGATYEAFLDCVHPDDREFVELSVRESLENKKPFNIEHRIIWPDGEERIVRDPSDNFYDKEGKPFKMK